MIALLKDIYRTGGTANYSETPITFVKDGELKEGCYTFSVKTLSDGAGNADSILSIGIDVTEQVKARQQIEASGARLKTMFDQKPSPTLITEKLEIIVAKRTKELKRSNENLQQFAHVASHDLKEGTGLGLPLCKKIVELYGGNIVAVGSRDNGATFIITLTLQQKNMGI